MTAAGLAGLPTPCLLLDRERMQANIDRMAARARELGVRLRPHVKTCKSAEIARRLTGGHDAGITVSTLREAEYFADAGFRDILYAVSVVPQRMARVLALKDRGIDLQLLLDAPQTAREVAAIAAAAGRTVDAWIEIDVDGHRAGLEPDDPALIGLGRLLQDTPGIRLAGVLTHAGGAYDCRTADELERHAEQERRRCVRAARNLETAGVACPAVSVGSTPTALAARSLDGVSELRAGVYVFFDLFQAGLGVCSVDDIALSVLTTVISHKRAPRRLLVDAGGLALSKDRGTAGQARDCGYGLVARAADGRPVAGLRVGEVNQEHGLIDLPEGCDFSDFPVGSRLRILPNHACMTAAAHDAYHVLDGRGNPVDRWPRCNGW
jgi:D-serine deaminase-like pyridoxal phosphate-dependent protein